MLNRFNPNLKWLQGAHRFGGALLCLLAVVACLCQPATLRAGDDIKLHSEAKKAVYQKEWQQAIPMLEKIDTQYATSVYHTEALFWLAYSLDKNAELSTEEGDRIVQKKRAVRYLNRVIERTDKNPWIDDAKILRIRIAVDLVRLGEGFYKGYILKIAQNEQDKLSDLRLVALDALMRIDRPRALQLLVRMYMQNIDTDIRDNVLFLLNRYKEKKTIALLMKPSVRKSAVQIIEYDGYIDHPENKTSPPKVIWRPLPEYPREALEKGITGSVVLEVTVDRKGRISQSEIVGNGHPILKDTAQEIIKKWRYKPFTRNGMRREISFKIRFDFSLK
jgi:protein TonB